MESDKLEKYIKIRMCVCTHAHTIMRIVFISMKGALILDDGQCSH